MLLGYWVKGREDRKGREGNVEGEERKQGGGRKGF